MKVIQYMIIAVSFVYCFMMFFYFLYTESNTIDHVFAQEQTINVSCASQSMGLSIDCTNQHYVKAIKTKEELELGGIYVFKDVVGNRTFIHRYILDCSDGCYGYIFKGDNNWYADRVVPFEDIKYRLVEVDYN